MCLADCLPSEWLLGWQVMSPQLLEPLGTCPVAVIMVSGQSSMTGTFEPMTHIPPQDRVPEVLLCSPPYYHAWVGVYFGFSQKKNFFPSHTVSHIPFTLPILYFTTTRLLGA